MDADEGERSDERMNGWEEGEREGRKGEGEGFPECCDKVLSIFHCCVFVKL